MGKVQIIQIANDDLDRLKKLQKELPEDEFIGTEFKVYLVIAASFSEYNRNKETYTPIETTGKVFAYWKGTEVIFPYPAKPPDKWFMQNINGTAYLISFGQQYVKIKDNRTLQEITKTSERQLKPDSVYEAKIKNLKGGGRFGIKDCLTETKEGQTSFELMIKHTRGLSSETWKLLDFGLSKVNRKGVRKREDLEVTFSLSEYLQWKGLKDTKDSRKEVKKRLTLELNLLWNAYCETPNKSYRILSGLGRFSSGHVSFDFAPQMLKVLMGSTFVICHQLIYQLDSYRHPHSYYLGRKLSEHKRMNFNETNADIINVKTLLEICPELPVYDKDMKEQGQIRQRIIEPFERDLSALTYLTWSYITDTGKAVKRTSRVTYQRFITLRVKVEWRDYPEELLPTRPERKRIEDTGKGGVSMMKRGGIDDEKGGYR